jgi:hypothetical protein
MPRYVAFTTPKESQDNLYPMDDHITGVGILLAHPKGEFQLQDVIYYIPRNTPTDIMRVLYPDEHYSRKLVMRFLETEDTRVERISEEEYQRIQSFK